MRLGALAYGPRTVLPFHGFVQRSAGRSTAPLRDVFVRQSRAPSPGIKHPIWRLIHDLRERYALTLEWNNKPANFDPLILFSGLTHAGYSWDTVEKVLTSLRDLRAKTSGKDRKPLYLDLNHLLKTVALEVPMAEFITRHSGFSVAGPWDRKIRPFDEMFPADRQAALDLYVMGERKPQVLFFKETQDLITQKNGGKGVRVPRFTRWGLHTLRAMNNFPMGADHPACLSPYFIRGLLYAKKDAMLACRQDLFDKKVPKHKVGAVVQAIDVLLTKDDAWYRTHLPLNAIQGGAGTATNMMINEVIANTAMEVLGGRKGYYDHEETGVSYEIPNTQMSTNDVIPSGILIGLEMALHGVRESIKPVSASIAKRLRETQERKIVVLGQTEGQNAVLMMLSNIMSDYAATVEQMGEQLEDARSITLALPMGATAVGSGHTATPRYRERFFPTANRTHRPKGGGEWRAPRSFHASLRDPSAFEEIANHLDLVAGRFFALMNDLWDKARAREFIHPELAAGSSIMPGKINPVAIEQVQQLCGLVRSRCASVREALKIYANRITAQEPLIAQQLFSGIEELGLLFDVTRRFFDEFKINEERIEENRVSSPIPVLTALAGHFPQQGHALGDAAFALLTASAGKPDRQSITKACVDAAGRLGLDEAAVRAVVDDVMDHPEKFANPHPTIL